MSNDEISVMKMMMRRAYYYGCQTHDPLNKWGKWGLEFRYRVYSHRVGEWQSRMWIHYCLTRVQESVIQAWVDGQMFLDVPQSSICGQVPPNIKLYPKISQWHLMQEKQQLLGMTFWCCQNNSNNANHNGCSRAHLRKSTLSFSSGSCFIYHMTGSKIFKATARFQV